MLTTSTKSFLLARFKNGPSASIDPPRSGSGSGCMPALRRRNLTGGPPGDPPTVGADFDAAPEFIRQIEVDQAVVLGEANRDLALRPIELGLRLQHIEGRVECGRARRIPGPFEVVLAQPGLKALAAQRPSFPVAVDDEIGKAGAIACVKEPGGRCDIEEDVRAAHGVRPSSGRPMAT